MNSREGIAVRHKEYSFTVSENTFDVVVFTG